MNPSQLIIKIILSISFFSMSMVLFEVLSDNTDLPLCQLIDYKINLSQGSYKRSTDTLNLDGIISVSYEVILTTVEDDLLQIIRQS
jgi:hypothetical protein